jgi:hypothetical protein
MNKTDHNRGQALATETETARSNTRRNTMEQHTTDNEQLKVLVSDIELSKDVYPDGLVLLVKDSWRFIGLDEKISVICSIDIT